MKFRLVERFVNNYQWDDHYRRHAIEDGYYPNVSKKEYLAIAEQLADNHVDMFKIQGYSIQDDNGNTKYIKWNRDTWDFVVYGRQNVGDEPIIISLYKVPPRQFKSREFSTASNAKEIPYGM